MTKTKKMDGYTAQPITEDDVANAIETTPEELAPDPEVVVATGDEENPIASTDHRDGMNTLYEKSRKNRDLVQREDSEGNNSVERIQALVAEAAGGEIDNSQGLDTNMPDRFAADRGEETEAHYTARLIKEQEDAANNPDSVEEVAESAADALPTPVPDAMVEVTILGRTMEVPQQDIDDAGGTDAYQKNRVANIKLQRAATLEKDAQSKLEEIENRQSGVQQDGLPSTDGPSEADIDTRYGEMMDVVSEGTEEDIKAWVGDKLNPQPVAAAPAETPSTMSHEPQERTETQEELDNQSEVDRVEANTMMQTDYVDIMADSELLGLAQQRFKVIKTNPRNEGRSQKEMAREAANYVRTLGKRLEGNYSTKPDPVEVERQTRVEKKRNLPQPSRADKASPSHAQPETTVPSRKEHFLRLRRRAGLDLPVE